MELVPGFVLLLQGLSATMTAPTFASLTTVLTGWVFASRRTVTRMILAAGVAAEKHFSSYHRLFSAARWSFDALGLAVFDLIEPFLGSVVMLGLDDTLARKRGLKMFGAGMHHDPLLSSRGKVITNWGHSWVVLGVIVELPFRRGHYYCLPILFRLYLNKKSAAKHRRTYRTRPELAVELLELLCKCRENRRFHVVADSAYGGQSVLSCLPKNCDLTSRLVKNARLYDAPPQRKKRTNGRPRKRGDLLPTPQQMLAGRCRRVTLDIYGRSETARLRELTASYVANLDQCERVLMKLSRQLELDEPVSLRAAVGAHSANKSNSSSDDHPYVDISTFCVVYRGRRCFLGNTLPFWLLGVLAQQLNCYVSYEQLLAEVWHAQRRSNEAIRNVAQILKQKLRQAGLRDLAAAIDGRNRGHYGLILRHHK